jgi:hypothetical protein
MKNSKNDETKTGQYIGAGIGIGIALGVAFGAAIDNVGLGIALGIAFGAAIGTSFNAVQSQKNKDDE